MSKPVEINGITFAPGAFEFLKKYTEVEFPDQDDHSLIDCDIEAIGELQTFFIDNWDNLPGDPSDFHVKGIIQGLHFAKTNLLEIRKLINPQKE